MRKVIYMILIYIFSQLCMPIAPSSYAKEVIGKSGMIVSAHPIASEFGLEILKSGGNAIDAAVGTALVLGVVEPYASGLGGGGCILIYLQEKDSLKFINYYARAPRLVSTDFNSQIDAKTAIAVLVPGTVAGLYHALTKYGTISWEDLLNQLIKKLKTGFQIDRIMFKIILDNYEILLKNGQTSSIYLVDGIPPEQGQTIINKRLLNTLEKLAKHGPEVFYQGEIADSIEAAIIRNGGGLRKSDLMDYKPLEIAPIRSTYRGYEIFSAAPPQSGITVVEILNIIEFKNLSKMGDYEKNSSTFHFLAEAMKRGFADRYKYLGDPDFHKVPTDVLISKEFAKSRFNTIDMRRATPINPLDTPEGEISPFLKNNNFYEENKDGSTTHISVIDAEGNAVSLTQTLNHFWGSGICVCGFLLNNGMTAFSKSEIANRISSKRQPRSSIAPSILFKNNRLFMVIGSPGSGRIITTMVEVICNIIDFKKNADEANEAPRFCSKKWLKTLPVEARFSSELLEKLKKMGHPIDVLEEMDLYFGGVQLIIADTNNRTLTGSSDPRRLGVALGY